MTPKERNPKMKIGSYELDVSRFVIEAGISYAIVTTMRMATPAVVRVVPFAWVAVTLVAGSLLPGMIYQKADELADRVLS